jgi:hypothetical protein
MFSIYFTKSFYIYIYIYIAQAEMVQSAENHTEVYNAKTEWKSAGINSLKSSGNYSYYLFNNE